MQIKSKFTKLATIAGLAVLVLSAVFIFSSLGEPEVARDLQASQQAEIGPFATLKVFGVLLLVLAMIFGLAYVAKVHILPGFSQHGKSGNLKILESLILTPKGRILLVQVANKIILLGVTENHISVLDEISNAEELKEIRASSEAAPRAPFHTYLQKLR